MIWLSLAIVILMGVLLASEHAKMRKDLNEAFNEGYRYGKQHAEARAELERVQAQKKD